ncbi:EAL domain-containing protein [Novispirillum sp. DQ9]|uniref:EAL domain-containing protein n=1 Tax=Novispirillum sp. DQ9 TaxID=3398612 RepID=UPI003C7AD888
MSIVAWTESEQPTGFDATTTRPVAADRLSPFMPIPLPPRWADRVTRLDIALQAIVNVHSGRCLGFEALLRGTHEVGFATAGAILDAAWADGVLPEFEAAVWALALDRFRSIDGSQDLKLFLNVDGRSLRHAGRLADHLSHLMRASGATEASVVVEVSERHPVYASDAGLEGLAQLRKISGRVAVDDFGTGHAGLPLLHAALPDYIKVDRFFLSDIAQDGRKKVLLRHLVNMAHLLGAQVVAEGVESDREFYVCKDIGCDLVQGFLVQRPTLGPADPDACGAVVQALNDRDRRASGSDQQLVQAQILCLEPFDVDCPMAQVFDRFRADRHAALVPVVSAQLEPLGIVREQDLKSYAYSPYGKDLLSNKGYGRQLQDFVWRCPVADINTPVEKILEIFSADDNSEGILIVEDGRYAGFLTARSLLRILNEKNIALARDQNPLTKLPGNAMINAYLAEALADRDSTIVIAYLDFDNFKPFNDSYGFRQGDRAITLFADILRKDLAREDCFIGHVGGDDFFAAFRGLSYEESEKLIRHVVERFRAEVASFYDEEARAAGHIMARMRDGTKARIPLLSASAALVEIPQGHAPGSLDELSAVIATTKKEAKASPNKLASITVLAPQDGEKPVVA